MTTGTLENIVDIDTWHLDFNDMLLLCGEFAKAHGYSMRDSEVARIRGDGLKEIKTETGFVYNLQGIHELKLKLEGGKLQVSYGCGELELFDKYLEHYRDLARKDKEGVERMNSMLHR